MSYEMFKVKLHLFPRGNMFVTLTKTSVTRLKPPRTEYVVSICFCFKIRQKGQLGTFLAQESPFIKGSGIFRYSQKISSTSPQPELRLCSRCLQDAGTVAVAPLSPAHCKEPQTGPVQTQLLTTMGKLPSTKSSGSVQIFTGSDRNIIFPRIKLFQHLSRTVIYRPSVHLNIAE